MSNSIQPNNSSSFSPINACDAYIQYAAKVLPEMCTTRDLVKLGLYKSDQAAACARRCGHAPDYFKLPNRSVLYPKQGVLSFLQKQKHPNEKVYEG